MQERLYRGKVADEPNEWVYGYLCDKDTIFQKEETEQTKCCGIGTFKVIAETIGQYTGLKDKNGKEIYEGDIVKCFASGKEDCTKDINEIGIVEFYLGEFVYKTKNCFNSIPDVIKYIHNLEIEVIGNIYDNPELLKGS